MFSEQHARHGGPVRRWIWRHPVAVDWLVAGSFAAAGLLDSVMLDGAQAAAMAPVIVIGAAALLLRRRHPEAVLGVLTLLGAVALALTASLSGFDLGAAFALYAVAAARTPRVAWTAFGLSAAAMALCVAAFAPASEFSGETGALMVLGLAAIAVGASARNRRLHVADLVERANAIARETEQRAQLASAAERALIAREMHDIVAHSLSVMVALADGAGAALTRSPTSAQAAIDQLSETGRAALADMRRVLGVLREDDAQFGPTPGQTDLDELVGRFRLAGMHVQLSVSGDQLPADTGLQLAVYRIVQESLTNALRHAQAGHVSVSIARTDQAVVVEVADDGGAGTPRSGRVAERGGGRGVIGMRERATIYGGTVEAGPHASGWRVRAVLPWEAPAKDEPVTIGPTEDEGTT
ncbi:sensor histidine kinase [Cellulomonas chengniuliangii]|uniref:histidine kinase n=1 Tax=Cellulomonas chengniuliangii TaxID=2968084 RepID=A0ABY5L688_9CELL|nr:histidine kinase [Cellulomonas chengniuliangii]MCC2307099.1 histidine kinase [Cellulomonas chengniuliangii]MCC2316482.1 histidine kinase [Cellulomonas chengniuliangii]UUI76103.1 histidine kinase [Cellulomonas chengniuliangii]